MSKKLLEEILLDTRFHCEQCPDGSWDVWFNEGGFFSYCDECRKPYGNKILTGTFRDTKEFDNTLNIILNRGKNKETK